MREDRYHCLTCCDEGSVQVWHSNVIDSLAEGVEPRYWYQTVVRCACRKGQEYGVREIRLATFNPDRHCPCGMWEWDQERGEFLFPTIQERKEQAREFANRAPVAVEFNPNSWEPYAS